MANVTITVDHLQRGQPRPYAPHTYESRITIRGERSWDRLLPEQVAELVKLVVRNYWTDEEASEKYPDCAMSRHFLPKLVRLERVEKRKLDEVVTGPCEEVWIACVEEPFTD